MNIKDLIPERLPFNQELTDLMSKIDSEMGTLSTDCTLVPRKERTFKPTVYYNNYGDTLEIHLTPDEYYVEWLNRNISVCKSFDGDRIVGCRIEGVSKLLLKKFLEDAGE